MTENVLEVHNLVKVFDNAFTAVNRVSFMVPKGKVVGLLGPNGAGKTTTIHMLLGITTPTSGRIHYFGRDFEKHKGFCLSRINFTSSFNTLQGRISVWENLMVFAGLYNLKNAEGKIRELIRYFEIEHVVHKIYWDLSSGQRTRVNIIKSLINDPELLLMDEPTASLDPDIADKTLSFIEELRKKRDISIVYTSHDMHEVTRICDEVIFVSQGKIVAHDTPLNLTKKITMATVRLMFTDKKSHFQKYLEDHHYTFHFKDEQTAFVETEEKLIPKLIYGVSKAGLYVTDIEINKPSLDDVFLQIARKKHVSH